ncbi:hypothetical protein L9F63_027258 [Diploptera punctata]|uniref:Uncharacterized protein n=1 Tax=Diploptera punctata TaxID=6984 RepID=A0AAD8AA98_DIPPU|nr:hypothetical protein L9F63_027258 [Diploptera punctata]
MRVPSQRSSRSNTASSATTSGKRIPSNSNNSASSNKKRKLLSDASSANKRSSTSDASSLHPNIKRKQPQSTCKRSLHHLKGTETSAVSKLLRTINPPKKPQPKKNKVIPLVGLKKIKIKEGKVTVKKILMTASGSKAEKNQIKPLVKSTKKQLNTNAKKMTGNPPSSTNDNLSASSTTEDQIPGSSCVPEDQKNVESKEQLVSKLNAKKKKSKTPSVKSLPAPLTRTKKLEKHQKLKPSKKISIKRIPVTRNIVISQEVQNLTRKKKITTRRKPSPEETLEINPISQKGNQSPVRQHENVTENANPGKSIISVVVQSADSKVNNKKTKDDEGAINKKKIVKRKPKIGGTGKGNSIGIAFTYSETPAQATKEKIEMLNVTPKRDGKEGVIGKSGTLKKAHKSKNLGSQTTKSKLDKKPVLKSLKVISSKVKKLDSSKKSTNLKVNKKLQQPKKKVLKTPVKKLPHSNKGESEKNVQNSPKHVDNNNDDSSTSDEITLDVLLARHQQQMKQEVITNDDIPLTSSCTDKAQSAEDSECKHSLPFVTSVKLESNSSRSITANSPPSCVNSSDEEDLRSIKNRIKVKLEENDSDNEEKKYDNFTKSKLSTKLKYSGESGSGGKKEVTSGKKELIKEEKVLAPKNSSIEQNKSSKKSFSVKHSQSGVKRSRGDKNGSGSDTEQRARRMKLFGFWSGPKRHRVASLNALAKVHCLYENESRGALVGYCGTTRRVTKQPPPKQSVSSDCTVTSTRTLRSAPGLRGMGKHWDMHNASSTSSSSQSSDDSDCASSPQDLESSLKQKKKQPKVPTTSVKKKCKQVKNMKKVVKRRRNRCELMMDLKDMVVRKRMASLNASAILAASYSVEKRPAKNKDEAEGDSSNVQTKKKKKQVVSKKVLQVEDDSSGSSEVEVEECDLEGRGSSRSVIEVHTTPSGGANSNKKVAVIVNQDTDVTITGVYVNSTTRSTHHEGFCSIAGMQYRISSTSHTQTEATAVATETVLHTSTAAEHPPSVEAPIKSYTPLGALSNMQPPGSAVPPPHHHHHPHPHPHPHTHPPPCAVPPQQPPPRAGASISPLGRRHGCASAFSAPPPPNAAYGPHHPPPPPPQGQSDPAYIHGE